MLTAETITDEQIRELRDSFAQFEDPPFDFECPGGRPSVWVATCNAALAPVMEPWHAGGIMMNASRRAARARIAEIISARKVTL